MTSVDTTMTHNSQR